MYVVILKKKKKTLTEKILIFKSKKEEVSKCFVKNGKRAMERNCRDF